MKTAPSLMATILSATCVLALVICGKVYSIAYASDSSTSSKADPTNTTESPSPLRVTIVDVGKGDCIILESGSESILIDTGYENTADDVLSCLQADGIDQLDAMIITHYDRDHIGGIRTIGESVDVGAVYLPGYDGSDKNYTSCISSVKSLGTPIHRVTDELVLHCGNARLTVLPSGVKYVPGTGKAEGNDNDMSLVTILTNGRDSYLFAGDLEEDGISAYLAANHDQIDVLKMPHHGQRASNTPEFLDDVRPQIVVITDAKKDPADKKTLKLLKAAGIETYRTSSHGTVVIASDGSGTYSISSAKGAPGTP